jgi:hypothetical protein
MLKYTCRNLFIVPERTGLPDYTWFYPVQHVPDYFSYHLQSEVIFALRRVPDYSGVV